MKMIDILNMMAEGKIEKSTKLIVSTDLKDYKYEYRYSKEYHEFFDKHLNRIEDDFFLDKDFLNMEVELIPPKEKKYRVRFKLLGSSKEGSFLSWEKFPYGVFLSIQEGTGDIKTNFTKSELQSIQPVREFLEDMEHRYELIEVES